MSYNTITFDPPVAHRQLFEIVNGKRVPKTTYTLADLWNYYHLCFLGTNDYLNASQYTTEEEIMRHRNSLLAQVPILPDQQRDLLLKLIDTYGLEVVLYAIDEYSAGGSVLPVDGLIYKVKDAEIFLSNLQRKRLVE